MGTVVGDDAHVRAAQAREGRKEKLRVHRSKRAKEQYLLVSDEAANRNASPAHTTHQATSHHAAGKRLAPWAIAGVAAIWILYIHGDGLRADERVLTTAAQGRVEGTGCHGRRGLSGVGFGLVKRNTNIDADVVAVVVVVVVVAVVADNVVEGEVGKVDVTVTIMSYHPCATWKRRLGSGRFGRG